MKNVSMDQYARTAQSYFRQNLKLCTRSSLMRHHGKWQSKIMMKKKKTAGENECLDKMKENANEIMEREMLKGKLKREYIDRLYGINL